MKLFDGNFGFTIFGGNFVCFYYFIGKEKFQ
jgi:hypothetical protein